MKGSSLSLLFRKTIVLWSINRSQSSSSLKMQEYFDKMYCINLDRRQDRWAECISEFKRINLTVSKFSAIDGTTLPLVPGVSPGNIGNTYSHKLIVENAKKEKFNKILVMEDDVEFHENVIELFDEFQHEIPDDWDLLFFGGNHSLNNIWMTDPTIKVTDHIYRVTKCYATHCYGVKATAYDKMINVLGKLNNPCDVLISELQRELNCYVIRPHLAWQRASYSDIEQKYADYTFLKN